MKTIWKFLLCAQAVRAGERQQSGDCSAHSAQAERLNGGMLEERSQLQNKERASRFSGPSLTKIEMEAQLQAITDHRRRRWYGDRSEKIRTYNYKDNRRPSRLNENFSLQQILEGDLTS